MDKHINTPLTEGLHTRKNKRISQVSFVLLLIKMDACGESDYLERERKENNQQDSRRLVQAAGLQALPPAQCPAQTA